MEKEYSYSGKRLIANIADPYARIVERLLKDIIKDSSDEKMIKNLKKYGKSYISPVSYRNVIRKSSLDARTFVRFILAASHKSYKIEITDEEIEKLNEYERERAKE